MRGIIVMAMFAVSLAHAASKNYTEVRDLSVDAAGLAGLDIDAGAGMLTVTGAEDADAIVVTATIKVDTRDEQKAREIREKHLRLTLERDDDRAELRSDVRSGWGWSENIVVDLDVYMPAGVALTIDDGSGSTSISGVHADVSVDDGSGSLEIRDTGSVRVDDGSGSVRIDGSSGDVYVNDGSGSIDIRNVAGSVTIDDGSGSITVDQVEKDLIIEGDGSGSVSFTNVRGTVEQDD